jgi:hypothetical protein
MLPQKSLSLLTNGDRRRNASHLNRELREGGE